MRACSQPIYCGRGPPSLTTGEGTLSGLFARMEETIEIPGMEALTARAAVLSDEPEALVVAQMSKQA